MPTHGDKQDRKRAAAVQALITHATLKDAAEAAGISETTLARWRRDPEFRAELAQAQGDAVAGMVGQLVALADHAVTAIHDGLDAEQPIHVRLRAADIYLGKLLLLRQMVDFEQRLQALEAGQAALEGDESCIG
jgi:transposase-like protein